MNVRQAVPLMVLTLVLAAVAPAAPAVDHATRLSDLSVQRQPDGTPRFNLAGQSLNADQLADALESASRKHSAAHEGSAGRPAYRLLNITSPAGVAWVGLGLLGQLLFTGRMIVQWLTSERARQSVVPPAFWWMSLGGAAMLLAYFAWRKDIVGLIGQGTGFLIYARNLWLLRRAKAASPSP